MTHRRIKTFYFLLTGLNTYATTCFFYYLFFFLRDRFGFGNEETLRVSAFHGFIYIFAAWQGGRFAQRYGYHTSHKVGYGGLTLFMIAGALFPSLLGIVCVLVGYSVALLFTWPALEALVSENETPDGVQHMVGIYNCTWATAAAVGYFMGGALYDLLGVVAVFWLPGAIFFAQFLLTLWLEQQSRRIIRPNTASKVTEADLIPERVEHGDKPAMFLRMAWLANPFAYVAVNTVFAVMPGIAQKLGLSASQIGLFCSLWLFARLAAFATLWQWTGWHYRFRWLLTSFLMLIAAFAAILLADELWIVIVAQLFFGVATGLIYYSSLFYSMDAGEAQAEHGGMHEAAIGTGIFAGPAVGAVSLHYFSQYVNAGTWAVSGLLCCGLAGSIWLRVRR
jgi:predicted MFS family arabinose efflux permease